jgi:hypothetical protein
VGNKDGDSNALLQANANNQDCDAAPSPSEIDGQDPDGVLDEDLYDPQSVLEDFLEDIANGRHSQQFQLYLTNKQRLIGKDVLVGRGNKVLNWKV